MKIIKSIVMVYRMSKVGRPVMKLHKNVTACKSFLKLKKILPAR